MREFDRNMPLETADIAVAISVASSGAKNYPA